RTMQPVRAKPSQPLARSRSALAPALREESAPSPGHSDSRPRGSPAGSARAAGPGCADPGPAAYLSSVGTPAVAHAIHRIDGIKVGVDCEKLLPDALHVRGDRAVVDHDLCVSHELIAVLYVTWKLREAVHHPELCQRQIDRTAAPTHREPPKIQSQCPAVQHFFLRDRRAGKIATPEQRCN